MDGLVDPQMLRILQRRKWMPGGSRARPRTELTHPHGGCRPQVDTLDRWVNGGVNVCFPGELRRLVLEAESLSQGWMWSGRLGGGQNKNGSLTALSPRPPQRSILKGSKRQRWKPQWGSPRSRPAPLAPTETFPRPALCSAFHAPGLTHSSQVWHVALYF